MRIIWGFIVIVLLVAAVGLLGYQTSTNILTSEIESRFANNAREVMNTIDIVMHSSYSNIRVIARGGTLTRGTSTSEEITAYLQRKKEIYGYESLSYFDMNRIRIADTEGLHLGKQHHMVIYWERALEGKMTAGQDVRIAEGLQIPIIYFAAPVKNKESKQIGVVVARYNPEEINNIILATATAELETHATLFDKDKNIIFSSDPYFKGKILKEKIMEMPSVKEVLKGNDGVIHEYHEHHDFDVITGYAHEKGYEDFKGNDWSLILSVNKGKALAPAYLLRKRILILTILSFLFALGFAIFISKKITIPIAKLTKTAEEIGKGNLNIKANTKSRGEIGQLAESFNQMASELKKSKAELEKYSQNLERQVKSRTKELRSKIEELEKFNKLTVGRELKMVELKKKIKEFKKVKE